VESPGQRPVAWRPCGHARPVPRRTAAFPRDRGETRFPNIGYPTARNRRDRPWPPRRLPSRLASPDIVKVLHRYAERRFRPDGRSPSRRVSATFPAGQAVMSGWFDDLPVSQRDRRRHPIAWRLPV